MKKADLRKQLADGMAIFLSSGKQITQCKPKNERKPRQKKEEFVEIHTEFLPEALRKKHFGE